MAAMMLEHRLSIMLEHVHEHDAVSNAVRNVTERTYVDASKVEQLSHVPYRARRAKRNFIPGANKWPYTPLNPKRGHNHPSCTFCGAHGHTQPQQSLSDASGGGAQ